MRRQNWLKLWSIITGVALVVALVLTFLPAQSIISTNGTDKHMVSITVDQKFLSIDINQKRIRG
jgi:energy-converting hydrogenase Eha subunit C